MMNKIFSLLVLGFLSFQVFADNSVPDVVVKHGGQLLSHNGSTYLVLNFDAAPKWHTYWKNPGDAGLPTSTEMSLAGEPVKLEALEWPAPNRYFEQGNMLAYGYEGAYSYFFKPTKEQLAKIESSELTITSKWLVCKHICIPGKKVITLDRGNSGGDSLISREEAVNRLESLPKLVPLPTSLDLVLAKDPDTSGLLLFANLTDFSTENLNKGLNLITPFPKEPFTFKHEVKYQDKKGNIYAKLPIEWDGEYMEPAINLPSDGKFKTPYTLRFLFANPSSGKVSVIEKSFSSFSLDAGKRLNGFLQILKPIPHEEKQKTADNNTTAEPETTKDTSLRKESSSSIFYFILFAFIGGLILNIMPCVLPVISLKLFGLISHSEEPKSRILKHNIFYTLGVLATFLLMAVVVVLVKINGESIGWGFQLQSPRFIAVMLVILFLMALNLFGLFEFKTPGGSKLGGVELKDGFTGDFFGGVLATILSTPCSAPFLGTALTFAFTGSNFDVFAVFVSIGLGLSAPFILTGIFPGMIKWLPKPGMWMEHVKKILGVTLLLTMVWLLDVFTTQAEGTSALIKLNTVIVLLFFAIYAHQKMTKKLIIRALLYIAPIALLTNILLHPISSPETDGNESSMVKEKRALGLPWEKWSEEAMKNHMEDGNLVFMDFTAKWCFTCKINEKAVIETKSFKELTERKGVKLLLADWTKRDPIIGDWLKSKGYVGVPAYFIQKPDGTLIDLGETITLKEIEKNLD